MTFLNYVEKLRGESEGKRRRVAFLSATVLTVLIFSVWLSVARVTLSPNRVEEVAVAPVRNEQSITAAVGVSNVGAIERIKIGWEKVRDWMLEIGN